MVLRMLKKEGRMPRGLDSAGELRGDEHSLPASQGAENSEVGPPREDVSTDSVDIYTQPIKIAG